MEQREFVTCNVNVNTGQLKGSEFEILKYKIYVVINRGTLVPTLGYSKITQLHNHQTKLESQYPPRTMNI